MKKNILLLLILFIVFHASSCFSQQTINGTLTHDKLTREYIIYLPKKYSSEKPAPLLLSFHGMTSNAAWMKTYTEFPQIADTAGFIVVFPQGTKNQAGATFWNAWDLTSGQSPDDIGFVEALLSVLKENYAIDETRIYCTGHSNGGFMSHCLAIHTNHFAAIASNAGTISSNIITASPPHPTGVLVIHGDLDNTVPYNGNGWSESVDETVSFWVKSNKCLESPLVSELPDVNPNDNCTITSYVYQNDTNSSEVELLKVNNGGHSWPGSTVGMGICNDIHTAKVIWKFVSRFKLSTSTHTQGLINKPYNIKVKQGKDALLIDSANSTTLPYKIFNSYGVALCSGTLTQGTNTIGTQHLTNGLYILKSSNQTFKFLCTK